MQEERREKTLKNNAIEIVKSIKDHIKGEMLITVERGKIDKSEKINGFPLSISDNLLVMSKIVDFHDEGFVIIRTEDITDAYSKESDAFYEGICIREGLKEKIFENPFSDIIDFASVFRQLSDYSKFVTIQCEYAENELYYSIGKVSGISDGIVIFNGFDKMGVWEDTKRFISLDEITLISIEDYYSSVFYKYVALLSDN